MKQALRLGFQSFLNIKSSALGPKNLRVGASVCVKPRAIVPQRKNFNSVAAPAKLRKSMDIQPADANGVVKNEVVEMEIVDNDSVEKMTVQELRLKLRSLGVPAKGCKQDLISALKSSLNNKVDGEDSVPKGKPICAKNNSKRKAKSLLSKDHAENISTGSEVSGKKRTKTRVKEAQGEDSVVEVETTLFALKQEQSIKTNEVTGAKIKAQSEITSTYHKTLDWVDVCETGNEAWTVLAHKKPQKGWIPYNPTTMRPPPLTADTKHVKLMSWNVNGLRALLKLEGFSALQLAQREDFDVLCLQETKMQEKDVEEIKESLLEGYENSFWTCSVSKLGYSGTAIISRIKPLSVKYGLGISDHDSEGRLVTVEFDSYYLLCGYVPNSGDGLRRLSYRVTEWDTSLSSHMKELEKSKPVILTGDLNCAHQEIDIFNPAGNKRSAGFTIEERQSFETNFLNNGFVDTFRRQHPGVVGYTYWGYRHGGRKNNRGWRLDYFLVSESIADNVHDSYILPDVTGSDHCPIGLVLKL